MLGGVKIENLKIYYFKILDSTNNKAKELDALEKEYIIYTDNQTSGRGQFDRKWISGKGLTFSLVVKKENNKYSSIVPKAIIKYLKTKGIIAKIKPPNDIYYKNSIYTIYYNNEKIILEMGQICLNSFN